MPSASRPVPRNALRSRRLALARRAWGLLHVDSTQARVLAQQAAQQAHKHGDAPAAAWAALTLGYHLLYFATPEVSIPALQAVQGQFDALDDRAGHILAAAGVARGLWRSGRFREALAQVLTLRDEGLKVLRHDQRGVLLNTIAGCYSAAGDSERAFAYMYEALREVRPISGRGFDTVIHCNLAHELQQLGDHDEALRHIDQGLERCGALANPRMHSALLINRVISLTELGRAPEALIDIERILAVPTDDDGRGMLTPHFETLALSAYRADARALGDDLLSRALGATRQDIPDEHVELALAQALQASLRGQETDALHHLRRVEALVDRDAVEGLSPRVRSSVYAMLADLHERRGQPAEALAAMRRWQRVQAERGSLASRARYQAATLQTELLRMKHQVENHDARQRATERARAELQAANEALSRKIDEVQALQGRLSDLAVRDALTGLFNRRHLNDTLPALLAQARRERQPLAVALIDLDHFKAVNDSHGHAMGDALLAAFGRLLQGGCRAADVPCRYGGEEFCLLLPGADAATAQRRVQALLEQWRQQSFAAEPAAPRDESGLHGLSFSAGVADSLRVPGSAERLLQAADQELLGAKRLGRARVLVHAPEVLRAF